MDLGDILNSEDIRRCLQNVPIFRGVFPSDRLPPDPDNGIYIVNFDDSQNPGTHWVTIHIFDKKIEYFDPLTVPIIPNIRQFITSINKDILCMNLSRIQSNTSYKCGIFACGYTLLSWHYNLSFTDILNLFENKSILESEELISDIFIYLISRPRPDP